MSTPTPLLFVSGPPVYVHVPFVGNEAMPVFAEDETSEVEVASVELVEQTEPVELVESVESIDDVDMVVLLEPVEQQEVDSAILAKTSKLQSPIGQRVYRGLTFVLKDNEVVGDVLSMEGNTIFIAMNGDENEVVEVELADLSNIIWRGKELPEN